MKIGYIGLGKMGYNMVLRLRDLGHEVVAYNRSPQKTELIVEEANVIGALSIKELVDKLETPRVVWTMVPNIAVDEVTKELAEFLEQGDTVIDGGNTYYKETIKRAKVFEEEGINYIDVGVSGGPDGARNGASLMIGGKRADFEALYDLFEGLAKENGYAHLGTHGAGHFAKMVHNGIEYGMMQAIAEGFDVLKNSDYNFNLLDIMKPYKNGSVIESALINWLNDAFNKYGTELTKISDVASHSGEGQWTIETAKEMGIDVKVIEESLNARIKSETKPSFQAKIVSAMRGEFGGHPVLKDK